MAADSGIGSSEGEGFVVCVCGPCGSGKSTIAGLLAERLGASLVEGDDFHPEANRAKMAAGLPLDDQDRLPWLAALSAECSSRAERGETVVLACSALKKAYRETLVGSSAVYASGGSAWTFALMDVPREVLRRRLGARRGHFMPPSLLDSQLAALEANDPRMVGIPAVGEEGRELSPEEIAERLHMELRQPGRSPGGAVVSSDSTAAEGAERLHVELRQPGRSPGGAVVLSDSTAAKGEARTRRWLAPGLLAAAALLVMLDLRSLLG